MKENDRRFISEAIRLARLARKLGGGDWLKLEVTPIDISATTIKSIIRLGRSPRSMLPDAVLDYINLRNLYSPV